MEKTRLDDMLERYGEICTQRTAGKILGVVPRTISRMMDEGRLRRVGARVDVRSIVDYIENPRQKKLEAHMKNVGNTGRISEGDFFAAAKVGRWAGRR